MSPWTRGTPLPTALLESVCSSELPGGEGQAPSHAVVSRQTWAPTVCSWSGLQ